MTPFQTSRKTAASRKSRGLHRPIKFVDSDLDISLVGPAIALLDTEDFFYSANSIWLRSIQVTAFDVIRVLPVVFWIQIFVHRLLPRAFYGTGQLDAAEKQGLRVTERETTKSNDLGLPQQPVTTT